VAERKPELTDGYELFTSFKAGCS